MMWLTMPKAGKIIIYTSGMTKEPEQVQEQDRVAAAFWNKEGGAKITVSQKAW